jgi:hypothetical protein
VLLDECAFAASGALVDVEGAKWLPPHAAKSDAATTAASGKNGRFINRPFLHARSFLHSEEWKKRRAPKEASLG